MSRFLIGVPAAAAAMAPARAIAQEAPPLTLAAAIEEALAHNPALAVLRGQAAEARQRPAQERFLTAPMVEAQLWQWPIGTLRPMDTSMVMFTVRQDLPGRGKRDLRAAAALKDTEVVETAVRVRALEIVDEVKRTDAERPPGRRWARGGSGSSGWRCRACSACRRGPTRRIPIWRRPDSRPSGPRPGW